MDGKKQSNPTKQTKHSHKKVNQIIKNFALLPNYHLMNKTIKQFNFIQKTNKKERKF